ncbi:MAG: NADH-quinone oxidoreductase subunit L [Firmicutes bacterium]|nr:NADH-quinone oxidoreductase subunit L [Bacillota bacterium]
MTTLLILVPLIGLILVNLPFKNARRTTFWYAVMLSLMQAYIVLTSDKIIWEGHFDPIEEYFKFNLKADNLTLVMLLSIGIVAFCALMVAKHMIKDEGDLANFSNLIIIILAGMNGVVMTTDVFTLYIFLEITAVTSFIMIAFFRDKDALEGSFKYIVLSAVATVLLLASIALVFMVSGGTSFEAINRAVHANNENLILTAALALFTAGLLIKGGLVPFHGWLPDAYSSAPAPASVILAGIVTKTTGIYSLIRIVNNVFGFSGSIKNILLFVGIITIFVGALAALGQKDFKRMLAYSSISQVGYIVISLGTGTELGLIGAMFHLFNHSIFKAQLFVNSAAVEKQAGTRDLDKMGGFSKKMPFTGLTSLIACLSTAGIPPLAGFWSKLIIIVALWNSGHPVFAGAAVLASVITLGYFLVLQRKAFFGKLAEGYEQLCEAEFGLILPAIILTLITVAVGLLFPLLSNNTLIPMSHIF